MRSSSTLPVPLSSVTTSPTFSNPTVEKGVHRCLSQTRIAVSLPRTTADQEFGVARTTTLSILPDPAASRDPRVYEIRHFSFIVYDGTSRRDWQDILCHL